MSFDNIIKKYLHINPRKANKDTHTNLIVIYLHLLFIKRQFFPLPYIVYLTNYLIFM